MYEMFFRHYTLFPACLSQPTKSVVPPFLWALWTGRGTKEKELCFAASLLSLPPVAVSFASFVSCVVVEALPLKNAEFIDLLSVNLHEVISSSETYSVVHYQAEGRSCHALVKSSNNGSQAYNFCSMQWKQEYFCYGCKLWFYFTSLSEYNHNQFVMEVNYIYCGRYKPSVKFCWTCLS